MDDFDQIGDDMAGFDYSSLLKGAGGLLSGISEGFGGQKPQQQQPPPPPPPSNTWKYAAIGVGALAAGGIIIALVATRKK
jgi:hypothetical protein